MMSLLNTASNNVRLRVCEKQWTSQNWSLVLEVLNSLPLHLHDDDMIYSSFTSECNTFLC